jgi:malonyl-CoA O-methyltransferase
MNEMREPSALNKRDVRRQFDRAAASFDGADFVHRVTRDGLLERLQPLRVKAETVLDLGAATGSTTEQLRKRFDSARVVSLDLSHDMLREAVRKRRWFSRTAFIQADAERLPFSDASFDVVFSNLLLPWLSDPAAALAEVARVLRKDGVFTFATLGPDSLLQLSRAWSRVDTGAHVNRFLDMHDIGDALVRAGLADPVLDVDRLTVKYADPARLFQDLTRTGARNALQQRGRGLLGRRAFEKLLAELGGDGKSIAIELELVYGHCWGTGPRREPTNYRIDAAQIGRRRKS